MDRASCVSRGATAATAAPYVTWLASLLLSVGLAGCGDQVREPTPEQIAAFREAGIVPPIVDMNSIQRAKLYTGPYRVVPGDVLEFTMPALLQIVSAAEAKTAQAQVKDKEPYICRVSPKGTITLPAVGEMEVKDQALAEIEENAIKAYTRYVVLRPSIYIRVLEYKTCRISIAGAVAKPGVYTLRNDQLFLATLLMEAGGIAKEGAATIRIGRLHPQDGEVTTTVLPVKGFNIPFRDVSLQEGDSVVVEQMQMPLFCVLGLVNHPGNFPYPPTAEYTVTQAIGFAGGLDPVANPHYVTIYRLAQSGMILRVSVKLIAGGEFTDALRTPIRPGDVIAVEHTPRTRLNSTVNALVRINTGIFLTGSDLWNHD